MGLDIHIPHGARIAELPDPDLLNYYEQAERRTIWIDFGIDSSLTEVGKKILQWNHEDADHDILIERRTPIRLILFTSGGDAYAMWSLVDIIMMSQTPVYTYMGVAFSAGCSLLIAGHKRFAFPHGTAMWHSGQAGLEGTVEEVKSASGHLASLEKQSQDFFLSRTKVDLKKYKKMKDATWYFTAQEALKYGLVDEILTSAEDVIGTGGAR